MNKTGLFFGSFNPVHIGHLAIANYMVEYTYLNELWFIISPHNPLKKKASLLNDYHRYQLLELGIADSPMFRISDIEFKLPQPSYTIDTLTYLSEKHPKKNFVIILGSDGLTSFKKWKNYESILSNYDLIIYPRSDNINNDFLELDNVRMVNAPKMEISSSFIRKAIRSGKDIRHFLPDKVYKYIIDMHFYEK